MIRKHITAVLLVFLLLSQGLSQTFAPTGTPLPATAGMPGVAGYPVPGYPGTGPVAETQLMPESCATHAGVTIGPWWVQADYLLWWVRGAKLPPLVTASVGGTPIEQAGVLGLPTTEILVGDEWVNGSVRNGFRVRAGSWLDSEQIYSVESSFFLLQSVGQGEIARGGPSGEPVIARPFFATDPPQGAASALVSFPDLVTGSTSVHAGSANMLGFDVVVRERLWADCSEEGSCWRIDVLGGYRWLRFADSVRVFDSRTALGGGFLPGTEQFLEEEFVARNSYHGVTLGFAGYLQTGPWTFNSQVRLGLGNVFRSVQINGTTLTRVPGEDTTLEQGGLLALSSNIGNDRTRRAVLVPEVEAQLGYNVRDNVRITAGYSFLFWQKVARAAQQIDLRVNRDLIPPPTATGPAFPALLRNYTDLWVQGLTLGLECTF